MSLQIGIFFIFMLSLNVADASPVLIVNNDGTVNTTFVPYTILAALGYGAAAVAGASVYNLWSPVIEKDSLKTVPNLEIAKNNRVIMTQWLRNNVGDPGKSPALESFREVVTPLVTERGDLIQPAQHKIPVSNTRWSQPVPKGSPQQHQPLPKGSPQQRRKVKPQAIQSKLRLKPKNNRGRPIQRLRG